MKNQIITFTVLQGETVITQTIETKKEISLQKTASAFSGMLHKLHNKVESLKKSGFTVKKPFSYHKPFALVIKVNGKVLIDSEQANSESILQIVLKAKTAINSPKPLSAAICELSDIVTIKY